MTTDNPGRDDRIGTAVHWAAIVSVVGVALIAAVVSYSHMQELAHTAGERWRSYLLPLSADGLIVAASMVLINRQRQRLPMLCWPGVLAWFAVVLGCVVSLVANMADAHPDSTARVVAGWAPVAFALCFELLLHHLRTRKPTTSVSREDVPERSDRTVTSRSAETVPFRDVPERSTPSRGQLSERSGDPELPAHDPAERSGIDPVSAAVLALRPATERSTERNVPPAQASGRPGTFRPTVVTSVPDPERSDPDPVATENRSDPTPERPTEPSREATGTTRDEPAERSDTELLTEIKNIAVRAGKTPSIYIVKNELKIGSGRATRLLTKFNTDGSRRTA